MFDRTGTMLSSRDGLRKKLDDATALVGELTARLEKLGQNVGKLASEKGELARGLADAKVRLEELRRQTAAAEARAAMFRNLVARLKSMSDSGKLKVVIRDGRMLIALPNDVLFDSGKTDIKADGQAALADVTKFSPRFLTGISLWRAIRTTCPSIPPDFLRTGSFRRLERSRSRNSSSPMACARKC